MLLIYLFTGISSSADVTITTTSSKGWSKSESFNNLGLTTNSNLSGPGVPAATLTPDWRGDGSLAGVTFTTGGDTHSATFKPNGTLAILNAPGGKLTFGYSPDGVKDLISVAWPAVVSSSFSHSKPVFGVNHGTETKSLHGGKMRFLRPKHKSPEILVVNWAVHRIPESCQTSPVRLPGVIASHIFSMSDEAVVFRILILCPERLTSTSLPVASLPALTSVSGSTNAIPLLHFF